MLNGATFRAAAIAGTAVFKMVVSSDSMKNATATSHGSNLLLEAGSEGAAGKLHFRSYFTGTSSTTSQYWTDCRLNPMKINPMPKAPIIRCGRFSEKNSMNGPVACAHAQRGEVPMRGGSRPQSPPEKKEKGGASDIQAQDALKLASELNLDIEIE